MEQWIRDDIHKILPDQRIESVQQLSGGSINTSFMVKCNHRNFFIKLNKVENADLFRKEVLGLNLLNEVHGVNIPTIIGQSSTEFFSYLILEYISPTAPSAEYWENLGSMLACLHEKKATANGLDTDNYIGSLVQINKPTHNWIKFFIENRLQVQLSIIKEDTLRYSLEALLEQLYKKLTSILSDDKPSLLHGDLWSGNILSGQNNKAYFIDPAVYYGHREVDLAFTKLFGGFSKMFYDSYLHHAPLPPGHEDRFEIYNLYPLLVHHNLFGGSYINQVIKTIKKFI